MRPALAIASALLVATGLAACGEKDEPESVAPTMDGQQSAQTTTTTTEPNGGGGGQKQPSLEEEIETTVAAVLGGGDPSSCSGLATTRYVRTAYGDEQGCRAATQKQDPFDVAVTAVDIRGASATAKAKPAAGPNKGETIKVELVKEGPIFKVDSAVSNAPAGP